METNNKSNLEKYNELVALGLEDIVSPKLPYHRSKYKRHFFEYGIVIGRTESDFSIIQDIHGNHHLLKISEIDKIQQK